MPPKNVCVPSECWWHKEVGMLELSDIRGGGGRRVTILLAESQASKGGALHWGTKPQLNHFFEQFSTPLRQGGKITQNQCILAKTKKKRNQSSVQKHKKAGFPFWGGAVC